MIAAPTDLAFAWYAPTHGDAGIIGGKDDRLAWSPAYIDEIAVEAEQAGFDSILIPAGPSCADPFVTATHIALATTRIAPLIAVRTGSWLPTVAAKTAMTLDQLSGGRVKLNIVSGGSPIELAMDGDHESHDVRYRRTREYLQILRLLAEPEPATFSGEFFDIRGASFTPAARRPGGIPLYLGGASDDALRIAAENADVYLMWGERVEDVEQQLVKARAFASETGRSIRHGMRINLIVRKSSDEAWAAADAMVASVDDAMREKAGRYIADSDSQGVARLQRLAGESSRDSAYWTGMVPYRSGNSSALVGSPDEVAKSLQGYVDAGISEFIFSAYPHRGNATFIGEHVLPQLRDRAPQSSSAGSGARP
jgi:alkanesulfonate monooxygenase